MSTKISEEFLKKRHEFPPMFITTTFDKHWSEWTRHWPDSVILKRLQVLANSAKQTLISQLENPSEMDPKVSPFRVRLLLTYITIISGYISTGFRHL